jgi:hypothetical protein
MPYDKFEARFMADDRWCGMNALAAALAWTGSELRNPNELFPTSRPDQAGGAQRHFIITLL